MTNYKVDILCVSEARWTDSGRRILASGHTIFYSGRTDNLGGVAVIVTRKVEKTLLEWKPEKRSIDESEIQLKVCKVDNNRMLRANGRSRGRRKGQIINN